MSFVTDVTAKYSVIEKLKSSTLYHLTDRSKFKLDPKFLPADNTFALEDRSGRSGIYLAPDVELWVHGHHYWRPFVVELHVDPTVVNDTGVHGRWGGEIFIPSSSFSKIKVQRVIPIDAYCREKYGSHGWIEREVGQEFDTGNPITAKAWEYPFQGYKYSGSDVRDMSTAEVQRLKQQLRKVIHKL